MRAGAWSITVLGHQFFCFKVFCRQAGQLELLLKEALEVAADLLHENRLVRAASGGSVWRRERIRLCALSARRGPKEVMILFLSLSLSLSFVLVSGGGGGGGGEWGNVASAIFSSRAKKAELPRALEASRSLRQTRQTPAALGRPAHSLTRPFAKYPARKAHFLQQQRTPIRTQPQVSRLAMFFLECNHVANNAIFVAQCKSLI